MFHDLIGINDETYRVGLRVFVRVNQENLSRAHFGYLRT